MKRYEKKYGYVAHVDHELELSLLEQGFVPAYEPRLITSIYYDTSDFSLYVDSVRGYGSRFKIRVRFYNLINQSIFEKKVRAYDTGYKQNQEHFAPSLISLPLHYSDHTRNQSALFNIPTSVDLIYSPLLVISYFRRYFVHSIKPDLRITLDSSICFGRVVRVQSTSDSFKADISALANRNVLEVKFSSKDESFSSVGVSSFAGIGLVNERHSKYCNAVEALF